MNKGAEKLLEKLKHHREEMGLSLQKLSELTGISVKKLNKIENFELDPSFKLLDKIFDKLNLELEFKKRIV